LCLAALFACDFPAKSRPDTGVQTLCTVVVDAGHSLSRSGATSARGRDEYSFNTRLARQVATSIERARRARVLLIEAGAEDLPPASRALRANREGAHLLLSLHHDSVQPRYLSTWTFQGSARAYCDRFRGYSLFYSERNASPADSRALAIAIGRRLRKAGFAPSFHHAEPISGEGRELVDREAGVYRFDQLVVLRTAMMPAVLIEAGVIVNREEEEELMDPRVQARFAQAVGATVTAFLEEHRTACKAPS
jgi:N-acetylmuramoyl-L-alanine amidase